MWWLEHDIRMRNTFTKEALGEIPHPTLAFAGGADPEPAAIG